MSHERMSPGSQYGGALVLVNLVGSIWVLRLFVDGRLRLA